MPLSKLHEIFEKFHVVVPEFCDGSHQFDCSTPEAASLQLSEEAGLTVANGHVTAFWIHRPQSSQSLWLALLDAGFVMIQDSGPAFSSPTTAREVAYLPNLVPDGLKLVVRIEDFLW